MATITKVQTGNHILSKKSADVQWLAMVGSTADVGEAVDISTFARASVYATATFGSSTLTIQVSNDKTNWVTAKDTAAADLTFAAAALKYMTMGAKWIRPSFPSGTGTGLNVYLHLEQ